MIGKGLDCLSPLYIPVVSPSGSTSVTERLRVSCGHCFNCKMKRAREWCLRLAMEAYYYEDACFCTLTYNDENLPMWFSFGEEYEEVCATLFPRHSQLFFKRLRKDYATECARHGCKCNCIRYYLVGEYGSLRGRPHYHALIFGLPRQFYYLVQEAWTYGFAQTDDFTPGRCSYVAGYVQKKLYHSTEEDLERFPEFMRCSKRLGMRYFKDHIEDILRDGFIMYQGYKHPIPRHFVRYAVQNGYQEKMSMELLADNQKRDYLKLCAFLHSQGADVPVFFRNRFSIAKHKVANINHKRDTNIEF